MINEGRMFGLDAMRAFAILLVITHHGFSVVSFPFIPLPDGVDVFFVLSGFLVGKILMRTVIQKEAFTVKDIWHFLLRRWFRTLPALWFALIINLVITFLANLRLLPVREVLKEMIFRDRLWEYLFFLQNLFDNLRSAFFPESWSLSVEEWFYAILPIMLLLFLKISQSKRQAILLVILLMIVLPSFIRYFFSDIHLKGSWMGTRMIVVMRLDSIAFGVLSAYVYCFEYETWMRWAKSRPLMISGIVLFYISFLILNQGFLFFNSITITNLIFFPLSSLAVMVSLPGISTQITKSGMFGGCITLISKISYSMYLVNYSIVIRLIHEFSQGSSVRSESSLVLYSIYWLSTVSFAVLIYRYIEMPFLAIRDRYYKE